MTVVFKEVRLRDLALFRAAPGEDPSSEAEGRTIIGYGSTFEPADRHDSHGDIIAPGAFAQSIKDHESGEYTVKLYFEHWEVLGVVEELREDERGLWMKARISETERGDEVIKMIRDGALDSLSIGFRMEPGDWREIDAATPWGEPVREILRAQLLEISVVSMPSNLYAQITDLRSRGRRFMQVDAAELEAFGQYMAEQWLGRSERSAAQVFFNPVNGERLVHQLNQSNRGTRASSRRRRGIGGAPVPAAKKASAGLDDLRQLINGLAPTDRVSLLLELLGSELGQVEDVEGVSAAADTEEVAEIVDDVADAVEEALEDGDDSLDDLDLDALEEIAAELEAQLAEEDLAEADTDQPADVEADAGDPLAGVDLGALEDIASDLESLVNAEV